jgi:hypothetical protein
MDLRRLTKLLLLLFLLAAPAWARADVYVRVLTQNADVKTGPGASFRTMHVAGRGDVFPVEERGTKGYWFLVALEDGTRGWVYGEQVATYDVVDDDKPGFFTRIGRAIGGAILGPSPVPYATIQLSFSAGLLGGEGVYLFRPAWLLDPYFALEGWFGQSPAAQEDIFLAGLGWTLRMAPGFPLGPYLHAGVGMAHRNPKEDAFTLQPRTQMAVCVGGGLEITLKKRITLRIDARQWMIFDENEAQGAQEYTGGLAIFF